MNWIFYYRATTTTYYNPRVSNKCLNFIKIQPYSTFYWIQESLKISQITKHFEKPICLKPLSLLVSIIFAEIKKLKFTLLRLLLKKACFKFLNVFIQLTDEGKSNIFTLLQGQYEVTELHITAKSSELLSHNGKQPQCYTTQWKRTSREDNLNWRQLQKKTTSMEDGQNGKRHQWKKMN